MEGVGVWAGDPALWGEGLALSAVTGPADVHPLPASSQAKLRSRNRSADEGEPSEGKAGQKELMQRSKSCKGPGLGKPHALPPKPDKSSG